MKKIGFLLIFLILSGCASVASGPPFEGLSEIKPEKASLIVYRPNLFFQGGTYCNIEIQGISTFPLRNGGYREISLDPGDVEVAIVEGKNWVLGDAYIDLNLEAGKRYYLRITPVMDGLGVVPSYAYTSINISGHINARLVNEEYAFAELVKTKYTE